MSAGDVMTFDEVSRRIKRGDAVSIRNALDEGLDPDLTNRFGWTLLMMAASEGNVAIGEMLLARGADLDRLNDFRNSALWCAVLSGHEPFVRLLLAKGADPGSLLEPATEDWMTKYSGQPRGKIERIYEIIRHGA